MPIDPKRLDVLERTTPRYTAKLVDDKGIAIPAASLATLTLTLYDKTTGNILNGRDKQNVLNTNNLTIDANGEVEWIIQVQDLAIVNANNANEIHVALFEWTWATPTKSGKHDVELAIRNLVKVP